MKNTNSHECQNSGITYEQVCETLRHYPIHYQGGSLLVEDPILREYKSLSLDELLSKLNQFQNKSACGFAHEKAIFGTPIIYPAGITEKMYQDAFFRFIETFERSPILDQVQQYATENGFNSTSCKHKVNNFNCGHPEKTGLAQAIIILITWLRVRDKEYNVMEIIRSINELTKQDANPKKSSVDFNEKEFQLGRGKIIETLVLDVCNRVMLLYP